MKRTCYQVYEYFPTEDGDGKRLIYTFDNEMAANDLVEFLYKNDPMEVALGVELYETTADV